MKNKLLQALMKSASDMGRVNALDPSGSTTKIKTTMPGEDIPKTEVKPIVDPGTKIRELEEDNKKIVDQQGGVLASRATAGPSAPPTPDISKKTIGSFK